MLLRDRLDERAPDCRIGIACLFAIKPNQPTGMTLGPIPMKTLLVAAILFPVSFLAVDGLPEPAALNDGSIVVTPSDPVSASLIGVPTGAVTSGAKDPTSADRSPSPLGSTTVPKPMLRLSVAGPKDFRASFAATNLGQLLSSAPGEQLWRAVLAPIDAMWRQFDGSKDFGKSRRRVLDYGGRMRLLLMVEPGEGEKDDRTFAVVALDPDGATDLKLLGDDLARVLLANAKAQSRSQTVDQHALRVFGDTDGFFTVPMVIGHSLVMFLGEQGTLGTCVPRGLAALATDKGRNDAPFAFDIDLSQLQKLSFAREEEKIFDALGLRSLRSLHATLRPNGVHAEVELEVSFADGNRGLFDAFLPTVSQLPNLLARVPVAATPWMTVPLRPSALIRTAIAVSAFSDGKAVETIRKEWLNQIGLHLDIELLDHLTGEVMIFGDLWQEEDLKAIEGGEDPPIGACIAWSVKDDVAFRAGFDKLLKHLKGIVNRFDKRTIQGVEITRVGAAFMTGMHMAIGKGLFAVAVGKEGVAQLEALVTTDAGKRGGNPIPDPVQKVQQLAPEGWNGVGLLDLEALFGGQVAMVLDLMQDRLPPPMRPDISVDDTQKTLDALLPLVMKFGLQHLVMMSGYHEGHWRGRLIW